MLKRLEKEKQKKVKQDHDAAMVEAERQIAERQQTTTASSSSSAPATFTRPTPVDPAARRTMAEPVDPEDDGQVQDAERSGMCCDQDMDAENNLDWTADEDADKASDHRDVL